MFFLFAHGTRPLFTQVFKSLLSSALLCICIYSHAAIAAIEVLDDRGHLIRLEQPAQRIVALAPHIVENLFEVGAGDQLVGVTAFSDYPPAAGTLPKVGDVSRFSVESILALKPDLIVAWADGGNDETLNVLERFGLVVYRDAPNNFLDIASSLRRLGSLSGHAELAEKKALKLEEGYQRLLAEYQTARPLKVFYQIWHTPLITANDQQLVSEIIRLCGGVNVFGRLIEAAPHVSLEAVLVKDPDVIFITNPETADVSRAFWQAWPNLKAVKLGHIFELNPDLMHRSTLRAMKGADSVCQALAVARK